MKRTDLFLVIIMALAMSGCNKVPEDVLSRTEVKNQAVSKAEKHLEERTGEIRYISPDELEEDIKQALGQTYSNFELDPSIKVNVPKEIVKCDFKQAGDYVADADMLFERIYGKYLSELYKPEERSLNGLTYSSKGKSVNGVNENVHFDFWQNGFLCFYSSVPSETGDRVGLYHVDRGDDLSDKYKLGDDEISVKDAVDTVQKWLDEKYADLEPEYKIRVKTVVVKMNSAGEYTLDFTADRVYKGIPIDELAPKIDSSKLPVKVIYNDYKIKILMRSAEMIDFFTNLTGIVKPVEKGTLDKVVSLKSALEHIEMTFADFENPLYINYIGLKYVLTPQYDCESGAHYDEINTVNTGKLVWEFVMDLPLDQLYDTVNGRKIALSRDVGDIRRYIYIDAETGEMEFEFDFHNVMQ